VEKDQFIEVAPRYYALAVISEFGREFTTTTRRQIIEYFSEQGDSSDPEDLRYRVKDGRLLERALSLLQEEGLIIVEVDHFGPELISPTDNFHVAWNLVSSTNGIYSRYERIGRTKRAWLLEALDNLAIQERRLGVQDSDYDVPDADWTPLPIERDLPEVQAVIEAIDEASDKIKADNGYSATKPEERNYVLDSLNTFSKRLKEEATVSWAYIRQFALEPLGRALKSLGQSATGLVVEAARAKIREWLMKHGWPSNWC
jgi:hypothetical protein